MRVKSDPVALRHELHGVYVRSAVWVEPHPSVSLLECNKISAQGPCLGVDLGEVRDALDVLQEIFVAVMSHVDWLSKNPSSG